MGCITERTKGYEVKGLMAVWEAAALQEVGSGLRAVERRGCGGLLRLAARHTLLTKATELT